MVEEGKPAPDFELSSDTGERVKLSSLRGKPVVLYFYPKDDTPGCTAQACGIRDVYADFRERGAVVLGVSLDTVEGHKAWCSKDTFSFKLLADPDHKVVDAYGVPLMTHGDMKYAARDTFLISPSGKIVKVWEKVDPNVHSTDVLAEIAANQK